jgi:hypothetical protein
VDHEITLDWTAKIAFFGITRLATQRIQANKMIKKIAVAQAS